MKDKFQIGDWVVRVDSSHDDMKKGDIDQVTEITKTNNLKLRKYRSSDQTIHDTNMFRLARPEEIPGYAKSNRTRFYVDTLEDKDIQNLLVNKAKANNILNCDFGYPEAKYLIYDSDNSSGRGYWFNSHHTNVDTEYTIAQAIEYFKQPKFKVGDWVTKISGEEHYGVRTGMTGSIKKFVDVKSSEFGNHFHLNEYSMHDNCSHNPKHYRLATPEEIKKATIPQIKVGDYTAEYNLTAGLVGFGCKRYAKNYIKDLYDIMTRLNIAAIKVEGEMVSSHQIEQIYEGFLE